MTNAAFAEVAEASAVSPSWSLDLEAWRLVPAQSPIWDEVGSFMEALRKVADEKLEERNTGRIALRESLDELCASYAAELEYFEARPFAWQAEAIAWDEAELVSARVARLRAELDSRRELLERPSLHYSDMRRVRVELATIEEAISGHISALADTFHTVTIFEIPGEHVIAPHAVDTPDLAVVAEELPSEWPAAPNTRDEQDRQDSQDEQDSQDASGRQSPDPGLEFAAFDPAAPENAGPAVPADVVDVPAPPVVETERFSFSEPEMTISVEEAPPGDAASNGTRVLPLSGVPLPPPLVSTARRDATDTLHARLPNGRYSPLDRGQCNDLLAEGPGVALAAASSAQGFEHIPEVVSHLARETGDGRTGFGLAGPGIRDGSELAAWLQSFAEENPDFDRTVVCQPVAICDETFADRVEAALRYCADHPERPTRVIFILGPSALWEWLNLPSERWADLASRMPPITHAEPWTAEAILDRLDREEKRSDEETAAMALDITGGFAWCLDEVFDLIGPEPDPAFALDALSWELRPGGDLHEELLMRLGVREDTAPSLLLQRLAAEGEVDTEGCVDALSEDEWRASAEFLVNLGCAERVGERLQINSFVARALGA